VLAFFLDFFELSFIVVPLLGPVAIKLGIDPVWFGVLLAVNMQTSFMHPPFGFALFYLRSVAPTEDYKDRISGQMTARITTGQIYWGAVPFVVIQIVMVALIIAFPGIVSRDTNKAAAGNIDLLQQQVDTGRGGDAVKPEPSMPAASNDESKKEEPEDPMEAIKRANEQDKQKK
jgi:hypothetical protein